MKANKLLLGSFVLAGLASSCTNDEIVVSGQGTQIDLSERTQLDLTLGLPVESRMAPGAGNMGVLFSKNDLLGAVLVDEGCFYDSEKGSSVDWDRQKGHVGNNKWAYNEKALAFETAGTTAVGAWLFYTKYNELMTTTRDGVKFSFPQIQEGAADFTYLANNNANFMITPVLAIDGYEGGKVDLVLQYASIYNYLNLQLDFNSLSKKVNSVGKIVVTAKDQLGNDVTFPTYGRILNQNLPVAALSLKNETPEEYRTKDLNHSLGKPDKADQDLEILKQYNAIRYKYYKSGPNGEYIGAGDDGLNPSTDATELWASPISYTPIVEAVDAKKNVPYLVVDCEAEHGDKASNGGLKVKEGLFDAWMLMPAGVYGSITLEIYTDAGVYTKTVNTRNAFAENAPEGKVPEDKGLNEIFLRSNVATYLSNIEGVDAVDKDSKEVSSYLKVTEEIQGTVVTKTADLINFINGLNQGGTQTVTVITQAQIGDQEANGADDKEFAAHTAAVINKDVMAAIDEKMKTYSNLQLVINSADPIAVIGGTAEEPLAIHDITFKNSCELKSGYVAVTKESGSTELIIPEDQTMFVKSGVNLVLNNSLQEYDDFNGIEIESGANVTINNHLWIDYVVNDGAIQINNQLESVDITNNGSITSKNLLKVENNLTNDGTIVADNTFEVAEILTNDGTITSNGSMTVKGQMTNYRYATIINNGTLTLLNGGNDKSSNSGTINNNSEFVIESDLATSEKINNAKNSSIILDKTAALNNKVGGIINNEGSMRCATGTGANKINNLGTINAKKGSRTYITTNSSDNENANGTNSVTMGTIVLENRNEDMSVTVGTQQGYIQYAVPAETAELKYEQGDKFNKVILTGNTSIVAPEANANRVKYVVVDAAIDLTLPATATVQEIEFNANTVLYAWPVVETIDEKEVAKSAKLAWVKIAEDVEVTVPTENAIYIEDVTNTLTAGEKVFQSMTYADINNEGEIIVGGDLYSTLPESITTNNGKFSSGDGEKTAFHWNMNGDAPKTDGYVLIGSTAKVTGQSGFVNALKDTKVKTVTLTDGEYTMPTTTGDVVISGDADVIVTINKPTANKVTLEGVTVKGSGVYTGIQHSNNVVYKNCIVKGTQCLYADGVLFDGCTVDLTEKADYIWTYGAKNVTFQDCVFNTKGKAILIYNEGNTLQTKVTVTGCIFNATEKANKAAIEIDSSLSSEGFYTLTTNNNIIDSNFAGEWRIKKSGVDNTEVNGVVYNAVTLDGVKM